MIKRFVFFIFIICIGYSSMWQEKALADENTTPSGIPLTELEAFVDEYVADYIGETVAGASIVVLKNQDIVLSKGYGYADIENELPMDPERSVLEWGSITKLFVWVAVMQLVEQGDIDLNEDIRTYLPEDFLTQVDFDMPISVLNLMNHQAGFEENIFDLLYDDADQLDPLEEALLLTEPDQVYPPGEVTAYSNYSTSLAAYMIEQITGQQFYDYVSDHILSKLDMTQSSIHLPVEKNEKILLNKTKGYTLKEAGQFIESVPYYISLYPSGGMNGSAEDLAQFAMALMPTNDETTPLFTDHHTLAELLSTSYTAQDNVPGIAHGFWEYDGTYRGLTHSGNTVAFSSNFQMVPEEDFAVIVLTNQADEIDLLFGLVDKLVGGKEPMVQNGLPDSEALEGTYLTARRMHSGFMNLYFYLLPLTVKPINHQEIEVSISDLKAIYKQTDPYVYKMMSGDHAFIPNQVMYFHVKDDNVEQITTSYADYLPIDKSTSYLYVTFGLFVWCLIYFLITPIVLLVRAVLRRRRKNIATTLTKWHGLLNGLGAAIILNVLVLAIRMLAVPTRAYSELYIHFGLNGSLTILMFVCIAMILVHWRKTRITNMQKAGYLLSIVSSLFLVTWLIIWQMYF